MPYLIQKKADGSMRQQWQLGAESLVFGRGKDAQINIEDAEMSKRHFAIECRDGHFFIRDLGSVNGTLVNKQPITEVELTPGDHIRAGQTHFVFEKGLGTVIGELAEEGKGYDTVLKEITKDFDQRGRR